jgi:hypothetical protein
MAVANQIKWAHGTNKCINAWEGNKNNDAKIKLSDCNKDDRNNIFNIELY